jgi:hypothetical protein
MPVADPPRIVEARRELKRLMPDAQTLERIHQLKGTSKNLDLQQFYH